MAFSKLLVDISLLRENAGFRQILIARTVSLMGLGMLAVGVPLQVYAISGSSFQVGLVAALDAAGMFAGLMLGGVLSDLHDRRRLILGARSICGLGFVALALNSLLPEPSVPVIAGLAFFDGFFGAIGVAALMASMPNIVGRENLMQAGALGMMTARFAMIVSPALGGLIIASSSVFWNYAIAAVATLITVITLIPLPRMVPQQQETRNPLRMLAQAFSFVFTQRMILSVFAIGILLTLTGSMRILFPALATGPFGGGPFETGLLYAFVPVGATLGAIFSGWARTLARPEIAMYTLCLLAFSCLIPFGLSGNIYIAMPFLLIYGYAMAVASLLQYTLIQTRTPDNYLGRVNSLWAAQDSVGEIIGALAIGALAQAFAPAESVVVIGFSAVCIGLAVAFLALYLNRKTAAVEAAPAAADL